MTSQEGASLLLRPVLREERWPKPAWPRATPRIFSACAIAFLVHATLVIGTGLLDRYRQAPEVLEQATPVEVVEEMPREKTQEPAQPQQQQQPEAASPTATPTPPQPTEPVSQAAAAPPPPPVAHPEPMSPSAPAKPVEVQVSHGAAAETPTANPTESSGDEKAEASSQESPDAPSPDPPYPSEREAATAEHALVPPSFRGAALPGAPVQTQDSYKSLVFGMLERAKRLPARTPARHGVMAAYVRFMLDRSGNLVSLSLIGSTGDSELDAEALALVRRAAPFPKPPPEGTLLTFTPVIVFGYDE